MTDNYSTVPTGEPENASSDAPTEAPINNGSLADTADTAREQASQLKDSAADAGAQVAETAKDQAATVVGEAKTQAKDLLKQARTELREQAGIQQQRAAASLHDLSDQLQQMANGAQSSGVAVNLVSDLSSRTSSAASWLDSREPGSLLDDVKNFARSRPGTFIAGAIIAGLVAGRLTRSVTENAREDASDSSPKPAARPSDSGPASTTQHWTAEPATQAAATPLYASLAEDRLDDPTVAPGAAGVQTEEKNW